MLMTKIVHGQSSRCLGEVLAQPHAQHRTDRTAGEDRRELSAVELPHAYRVPLLTTSTGTGLSISWRVMPRSSSRPARPLGWWPQTIRSNAWSWA